MYKIIYKQKMKRNEELVFLRFMNKTYNGCNGNDYVRIIFLQSLLRTFRRNN